MSININIEKLKKDRSNDDIIALLFYYAVFGEKISQDNLEKFKWYGIYAQDENQDYFSIKIPLNLGELSLEQLKSISKISKDYSQNSLNILNGQRVEFENIKLFDIPNIFNILKEANLSSFFESGHSIRRVLTCPANKVDSTQIYDVETIANKLNDTFVANKNFSNLPNSLQIAISGYIQGCDVGFLPDISFNATKDLKDKVMFAINLLDTNIGYISPSQVVNTSRAIANIYKDFGQRENLAKTSFKDFIENISLSTFVDILSSMLDFKIQNLCFLNIKDSPKKPRMGLNKSSLDDMYYLGCKLLNQKIITENFDSFINILEKYNVSRIKITHKANIIILDIPSKNTASLIKDLSKIDLFDSEISK